MRLLHTSTLQTHEFFECNVGLAESRLPGKGWTIQGFLQNEHRPIPEYAILSHVWGPEEISFQDIIGDRSLAEKKKGFAKVSSSCRQARKDGIDFIWIDTCCIDKSSSTELSEAINTMYRWYKDSKICYAYLSDVEASTLLNSRTLYEPRGVSMGESRWFTRGWTLQELLAPSKCQFFDETWSSIGMKEDHIETISRTTGIDLFVLNGGDHRRLSIARRMAWAAKRETTRVEDMAYCLLGIFDINMPLLYGEGENAFMRLQQEILKVSEDQSIFAWWRVASEHRSSKPFERIGCQGLLASSSKLFQNQRDTAQFYSETPRQAIATYTNQGIKLDLLMCQDPTYDSGLVYVALLNCQIGRLPGVYPGIWLRRMSHNSEEYSRIGLNEHIRFRSNSSGYRGFDPTEPQMQLTEIYMETIFSNWSLQNIFVRQEAAQFPMLPGFRLLCHHYLDVQEAYPAHLWDSHTYVMQQEPTLAHGAKKLGALTVKLRGAFFILVFGITYWEKSPWCHIVNIDPGSGSLGSEYDGAPSSGTPSDCFARETVPRDPDFLTVGQLKRVFEAFDINTVKMPSDVENRIHISVCEGLELKCITELTKDVFGRDMYLLHLRRLDDLWLPDPSLMSPSL
ncbi:hypothetical protein IFR05_001531 [Cadophora sp. M221]|nr:hypothetical protein IFR05_001531 [Cadophora sp. M221]